MHSTAILIFANSSEYELQRKPFVNGAQFFDALNERTQKIVQASGLPYYRFTEREQQGATFNERFVNAIEEVFQKGFENVIAIGNDTPHLNSADLQFTHNQLRDNKTVIGPSADGGIYLMGINKSDFKVSKFLELPWQSNSLAKALLLITPNNNEVVLLNTRFDLDTQEDLKLFISRYRNISRRLFNAILLLLGSKKAALQLFIFSYLLNFTSLFFNKGSPFLGNYPAV